MDEKIKEKLYKGWKKAVSRSLKWEEKEEIY
jgi:glycerol kinase